jgi:hypothetical protein
MNNRNLTALKGVIFIFALGDENGFHKKQYQANCLLDFTPANDQYFH